MIHQITLEELGIIPKQEQKRERRRHKDYAYPCGGCICDHCANSVECSDILCDGEREFGCFDCDECKRYDVKVTGTDKYKTICNNFKETKAHMESYAEKVRKKFNVIKIGERK